MLGQEPQEKEIMGAILESVLHVVQISCQHHLGLNDDCV